MPRLVWLAVAVGLVLRLGFGLGYWVGKPLTHDEREYLLLARSLTLGHGFTYTALDGTPLPGEHFGRAPVYPLVLAAVLAAVPGSLDGAGDGPSETPVAPRAIAVIKVVQAWMGIVVVLLLAAIARAAAGVRGGVAAAWLAALYPPFIWTPAFVFSETLFMVVALTAARLLAPRAPAASTPAWQTAGIGVLFGFGVLTRPVMLFFLLLAAMWLWRRDGKLAAVLLVVTAMLVVLPWSVRNTMAYGRFVAVASEGGITFWTGNHPLAIGEGDLAANPNLKRANAAFREQHPGLSAEALEPLYYRDALVWVREHPADWLTLIGRKAFYAVVPVGPSYLLHSPLYYWGSVIPYLGALALAIMGAARLAGRHRWPVPLLLLAASSLLVSLVFFPQERFRIPAIDPALIVLAAGAWLNTHDVSRPTT